MTTDDLARLVVLARIGLSVRSERAKPEDAIQCWQSIAAAEAEVRKPSGVASPGLVDNVSQEGAAP